MHAPIADRSCSCALAARSVACNTSGCFIEQRISFSFSGCSPFNFSSDIFASAIFPPSFANSFSLVSTDALTAISYPRRVSVSDHCPLTTALPRRRFPLELFPQLLGRLGNRRHFPRRNLRRIHVPLREGPEPAIRIQKNFLLIVTLRQLLHPRHNLQRRFDLIRPRIHHPQPALLLVFVFLEHL